MKFMKLKLEDIHVMPQEWLAYMEKKKNDLTNAGYTMDDETYMTYVLETLPQDKYQTMILVLKHTLRKCILMIEEAENFWMIHLKP